MPRQVKPNLAAVVGAAGSRRREVPTPAPSPIPTKPVAAERVKPATRTGTKMIAGHFPDDVSWQLRALAVERRVTVQDLLAEALNDLFAKHGKPEIARSGGKEG